MSDITGSVGDTRWALLVSAWRNQTPFQFAENGPSYRCVDYQVWFAVDGEHYEAKIIQL